MTRKQAACIAFPYAAFTGCCAYLMTLQPDAASLIIAAQVLMFVPVALLIESVRAV